MPDTLAPDSAHESAPTVDTVPPVDGENSTEATPPAPADADTPPANGEKTASPQSSEPPLSRAEARIKELVEERNFYRQKFVDAATPPKADPVVTPPIATAPPKLEDYDFDTTAWAQAHADWSEKRIEQRATEIVDKRLGDTQAKGEESRLQEVWATKVADFKKTKPDFDVVVQSMVDDQVPITPTMLEVLKHSPEGPAITHHLGTNRAELTRISKLPPTLQAAALGRLEATFASAPKTAAPPAAKTLTRAPAPPSPVGGNSPAGKSLADMPIDEYIANRPWAHS